jgi:hypothetical protein
MAKSVLKPLLKQFLIYLANVCDISLQLTSSGIRSKIFTEIGAIKEVGKNSLCTVIQTISQLILSPLPHFS